MLENYQQLKISTLLPPAHLVNPYQFKESGSEQKIQEIVFPHFLERSLQLNHDASALKTSPDSLALLSAEEKSLEPISGILCGSYPAEGTMLSGSLSAGSTLERPGVETDYLLLESPNAMSSMGDGPPLGQSRLEIQLKKLDAVQTGEILHPELLKTAYSLPSGWTDPLVQITGGEFLAKTGLLETAEMPLERSSIQELRSAQAESFHCNESSTSIQLKNNSPEPKKRSITGGRPISFGWAVKFLLEGKKTCTRRIWKSSYANYFIKVFSEKKLIPALDKDYRYGGKIIGYIWLTCAPYREKLAEMPASDLEAEGGMCQTVEEFIDEYFEGSGDLEVWVVRFKFVPLENFNNSPEPRKRSPNGLHKYEGCRCDKGQTDFSGRIEHQVKRKKLSSGELKEYEYNFYRYQLGGRGKVYSKVIPLGKLPEIAEGIAAGYPAEIITLWL